MLGGVSINRKNEVKLTLDLIFYSMTALVLMGFILRLMNIYDLNAHIYDIPIKSVAIKNIINWSLYSVDTILMLKILTRMKNRYVFPLAIIWTILLNIIWDSTIILILELSFALIIIPIINKKIIYSLWAILYLGALLLLQLLFVYALLGTLDTSFRYDYLMNVSMFLYLKFYVFVFYLTYIKIRRKKYERKIT